MTHAIDWSKFGPVSSTCYCRCDGAFRSHAKAVFVDGRAVCISQRVCPECGRNDNIYRVSHDPERVTLTRDDVQEMP